MDIAKGPGGYLAVGGRVDGVITELGNEGPTTPLLWRSADGINWTEGSAAAFDTGLAVAVASDGAEYLAVVQQDPTTHIYRSLDGVEWHLLQDPPEAAGGHIRKVIRGPRGFVAIGRMGGGSFHSAYWSSADGSDWTLVHEETDNSEALDIAAGPKGLLAVGFDQANSAAPISQSAWYSTDGISWLRSNLMPVGAGELETVVATPDGFFAAGWLDPVGIAIWRSADGTSWTALPAQESLGPDHTGDSGSVRGGYRFAGADYLLGYASCCGFPFQHTYISTDGAHWARVHRDSALAVVHLGTVIVEADRVVVAGIVLGNGGLGETGGIWIGKTP